MTKPADSDQIAKARRERAQQFCLQMQKDAGINKPHPTNFPPIRDSHELFNAMAAFAESERQAVIEECAQVAESMPGAKNDEELWTPVRERIAAAIRQTEDIPCGCGDPNCREDMTP